MVRTPKHVKEAFYQGHSGSTYVEAASLVLCLPLLQITGELVKSGLLDGVNREQARRSPQWHLLVAALVEWLVSVAPQILLYTGVLPATATCVALAVGLFALAAVRLSQPVSFQTSHTQPQASMAQPSDAHVQTAAEPLGKEALLNIVHQGHCRYISAGRGSLMLATCLCILAVDFRCFPRRFAKTETWGVSLMDVGVGGVVVAGGAVGSSLAHSGPPRPWWQRLARGLQVSGVCWLLWLGRLVSLRAVEYQEAVGEYGVHWNFFATVACLALVRHLLPLPAALRPTVLILTVVIHQVALSMGLGAWCRQSGRDPDNLLSLNKEGLVSLPGYWCLSLAGMVMAHAISQCLEAPCREALGRLDHAQEQWSQSGAQTTWWRVLQPVLQPVLGLIGAVCGLWGLVEILDAVGEPACRRCVNLTYTVWLCSMTLLPAVVLVCGQMLLPTGLRPVLAITASHRMLPLFLVANVMTGLVNLTVDTLEVTDPVARGLLVAYTACLGVVLVALRDVSIRLPVVGKVI